MNVEEQVARVVALCDEVGIRVHRHEVVAPATIVRHPEWVERFPGYVDRFEDCAAFWFGDFDDLDGFQGIAVNVEDEREEFGCTWANYGDLGLGFQLRNMFGLTPDGYHGKAVPYEDLPLLITALERELAAGAPPGVMTRLRFAVARRLRRTEVSA